MRKAEALERETGQRVIHFEKGDFQGPEFVPAPHIMEACQQAIRDGYVRYLPGAYRLLAGLHDVWGRDEVGALEVALLKVDDPLARVALECLCLPHRGPLFGQHKMRGAARQAWNAAREAQCRGHGSRLSLLRSVGHPS